ncbi:CBS domain-containing protein [Methylophaga pinxianii]|uniref:CBS domain-containing protein n=1 Tax=Methylophaga pinxianii TaxID=2881052 RepID=UPI001CF2C573|nr:CBS domain-containing protein [Methylophaga pinxianii]MCB2426566.1 CBS domain-containing protein [Methylophaga pinxianii]UPH44871.1 CBS domain-containing protein [Methylophaga pinxianii]
MMMNVKEIMNADVKTITPSTLVREAAQIMRDEDIGFIVVADNDALIGTLTDRDIVTRGVSQVNDLSDISVDEVMTVKVLTCNENNTIDEVASLMNEQQVQRMPVFNDQNKMVGVVSIGDMAQHLNSVQMGQALKGIKEGVHTRH